MVEAELESSSDERSDGSKRSHKSESDVEKHSTAAGSPKSDEREDHSNLLVFFAPRRLVFVLKNS